MCRAPSRRLPASLATGLALAMPGAALAAWGDLNLAPGVTPISRAVFDLHMLIFQICIAIGVVVFGVMFWSLLRHRKSLGREPAQFHHSTKAEIVWTVIPVLILVGMAVPATKTLIAMEDTAEADLTVKVTGYQWKWRYEYPDHGVAFYSNLARDSQDAMHGDPTGVKNYLLEVDNRVVIPTGRKVRFLVTSADVIHAWWVPALGMKKDAVPGYMNEMWARVDEPGVYRGQCAELCGAYHGFMPIVIEAVEPEAFEAWAAKQKTAGEEGINTASRGLQVGG